MADERTPEEIRAEIQSLIERRDALNDLVKEEELLTKILEER